MQNLIICRYASTVLSRNWTDAVHFQGRLSPAPAHPNNWSTGWGSHMAQGQKQLTVFLYLTSLYFNPGRFSSLTPYGWLVALPFLKKPGKKNSLTCEGMMNKCTRCAEGQRREVDQLGRLRRRIAPLNSRGH